MIEMVSQHYGNCLVKYSNSVYKTTDKSAGFYFSVSKKYAMPHYDRYWYGYRKKDELSDCKDRYYVFGCSNGTKVFVIPDSIINSHLEEMNESKDVETGEIRHWHIVFKIYDDNRAMWLLSKPDIHEIDISGYMR